MNHGWILDVLADLKAYARRNGLTELAEQIQGARDVAVVELAARSGALACLCTDGGEPARAANNDPRAGGGAL